jgi:hypothetical protein
LEVKIAGTPKLKATLNEVGLKETLTIEIPDVDPGTYLLRVAGSGAGESAAAGSTLVVVTG